MKTSGLVIPLLSALQAAALAGPAETPAPLTKPAAEAMVRDEVDRARLLEKQRLEAIRAVPASEVRVTQQGPRKVILRRVAHRPWPEKPVPEAGAGFSTWTEEQKAAWRAARPRFRTLHLSATVFDREITQLVWRKDQAQFTILSNVDFTYLTVVGSFEESQTRWSTFFFVTNVSSEKEARWARLAAERGREYTPRAVPDASLLKTGEADYLVFAEREDEIPAEMIEELDALHRHYAANEARLKVAWQRREMLNEAHRAWQQANPPLPKDTVINFWPVRSGTNGK